MLPEYTTITNLVGATDETKIVLYAIWEVKYHTITYHLNGGNDTVGAITGTLPGKYKYDETVTFGRPERTGYTLMGYYLEDRTTQFLTNIK